MARKLKKVENETQTLFDLEYGKKHSKMWKMRNTQCRTWIMVRKLKNVQKETYTIRTRICEETVKNVNNEKYTLQELDFGEKTEKCGK